MRQETTNTFDKGLNKDLNPIVTPNDVLTDCLNGTFITFNGDELTLQNDAGNTAIKIGDTDEVVRLSPEFYPLGIKEYGGVLYIVSGKKGAGLNPNTGEPLNPNDVDMVEFGSYPSPEDAVSREVSGNNFLSIELERDLYNTKVLNETLFKSGGYIRFENAAGKDLYTGENYLWSEETPDGLYIVKLIQQLDNGSYDLTDDIWKDYKEYQKINTEAPAHWLNSPDFKFFCPNRYKGKVAIRVELNEPKYFRLSKAPSIETTEEGFNMTFDVEYYSSEAMGINGYKIELTLDEEGSIESDSLDTFKIGKENKVVSYKVIPDLDYEWGILPKEFTDKFTIKGTALLDYVYTRLDFTKAEGVTISGQTTYSALLLTDNEAYLDGYLNIIEDLESVEPKAAFVHESFDNTEEKYIVLGRFTISPENNYALVDTAEGSDYADAIASLSEFPDKIILLEEFVEKASKQGMIEGIFTPETKQFVEFRITSNPEPGDVSFKWVGDSLDSSYTVRIDQTRVFKLEYKEGKNLITTIRGVGTIETDAHTISEALEFSTIIHLKPDIIKFSVNSWDARIIYKNGPPTMLVSEEDTFYTNSIPLNFPLIHVSTDPFEKNSANLKINFQVNSAYSVGYQDVLVSGWNVDNVSLISDGENFTFSCKFTETYPSTYDLMADISIPLLYYDTQTSVFFRVRSSISPHNPI